jgi:hypothetical protein
MTDRGKWALFLVCAFVVVIAVLALIGVAVGSEWATFVPDLIIGVIGASAIGLVLFALSESATRHRESAADVSRAYLALLDALTPLRVLDFKHGDAGLLGVANTRMLQLWEAVVPDDMPLGHWFEAERQMGLYRAQQALVAQAALPEDAGADAILTATAPFHQWVAEFSGNVRLWRVGKVTNHDMETQAAAVEGILRKAGTWRGVHYPWRTDAA